MIGLGFSKYYDDPWNIFDFSMVILSLFGSILNSVLSLIKSAKSAKTTKLLRLTKLNKIFKVFRAVRTIKTLNILSIGVDAFN
jgi:two pore calcium channel protein 3